MHFGRFYPQVTADTLPEYLPYTLPLGEGAI